MAATRWSWYGLFRYSLPQATGWHPHQRKVLQPFKENYGACSTPERIMFFITRMTAQERRD